MSSASARVRLLGPPEILRGGTHRQADTRKAIAVLAMLALDEDGTLLRDHLVDTLWPGHPLSNARNSLRRTLSSLRSAIGSDLLDADRTTVSLDRDRIDLDLAMVEAPTVTHDHEYSTVCPFCVPDLRYRIALFRGPFMDGFGLRDSPGFDDWQMDQTHYFAVAHSRLLERLAAGLAASGFFEEAADATRTRLLLDPLDESAHRQRIEILGWAGQRAEARQQFADCVRVLDEALGVVPLPETVALHDAVQAGTQSTPPSRPRIVRPVPSGEAPAPTLDFVGRDAELAGMAATLTGPGVAAVLGEAGVGKTRLVRETERMLAAEGRRVSWVHVSPGEGSLPFVVVRDAIEAALADFDGALPESTTAAATIAPAMAARGVTPAVLEGASARVRLLDSITAALDVVLGDSILVIDNAHDADSDSVDALAFALRRSRTRRWGLVVVARVGRLDALGRLLDSVHAVVHPEPFTLGEVETLVERRIGSPDQLLASALFERTGGNPFFLDQCLRSDQPLLDLPAEVRAAVDTRLDRLPALSAQVLGAAAVLGHPASLPVLREISGRTEDETAAALDSLVAEAFVRPDSGGFSVTHSIVRDAVRAAIPPARRALLHGRCADVLATGPDHAAVAHHLTEAGRSTEAAEARWRAGVAALRVHANDAATSHFELALALGHPDRARIDAYLGDLEMRAGRYEVARSRYKQSIAHGPDPDVLRRLGHLFRRWGRYAEARQVLGDAEAAAGDPSTLGQVRLESAMVAFLAGERSKAAELVDSALWGLPAEDELLRASGFNLKGLLSTDVNDALVSFDSAERAAQRLADEALVIAVLNNRARRLLAAGLADDALGPAQGALHRATRIGDRHHIAALHSNLADVLHALGRTEESMGHQRAAAAGFTGVGTQEWEPEIWMLSEW